MTQRIKLLKSLLEISSPSGFEKKIAEFIKEQLQPYLSKKQIEIDAQQNVIVTIKGQTNKKIMIDAHTDEVGFSVVNVDKEGLISLKYLGRTDKSILTSKDLIILTNKGKVNAVVDRKHSHLVEDEEDEKIEHISEAQIDIGIRGRKTVLKKINIGDPVVYKPSFSLLSNNEKQGQFIAGRGFDDKVGCVVLIEAIKELLKTKKKPLHTLIFVFSSQEEIGCKGAIQCVKRYKPDLFLEVDVAFASDYGEDLDKLVGRCLLGKGIVIIRGSGLYAEGIKLLENIAKKHKIYFQTQTSDPNCPYTSEIITIENGGIKALTMGIGIRNMHTPTEVVNARDINYGINLLHKFLLSKKLESII